MTIVIFYDYVDNWLNAKIMLKLGKSLWKTCIITCLLTEKGNLLKRVMLLITSKR